MPSQLTGTDLNITSGVMSSPFRPPSAHEIYKVIRLAAGLAKDADDVRELMSVMGLDGVEDQIVEIREEQKNLR